jgi:hypothetical protein
MNLVERLRNPASRKSWMLVDEQAEEAANFIEQLQAQIQSDRKQFLDLRDELILLKTSLGEENE